MEKLYGQSLMCIIKSDFKIDTSDEGKSTNDSLKCTQ